MKLPIATILCFVLALAIDNAAGAQMTAKVAPNAALPHVSVADAPIKIPDATAVKLRTLELRMSQDQQQITASQADQKEVQQAVIALLQKEATALLVDPAKYRFDDATLSFVPNPPDKR